MNQSPRRLAAIALAVLLIIGVGYGILSSAREALGPTAVTLHGLIGSEKAPFFADARVAAALKRGGFIVNVGTAGSRQIAGADLSKEDFAFPAGVPAAEKIRRDHAGAKAVVPFYTPMAPNFEASYAFRAARDLVFKGAWTGPAALALASHALAPVADLPVREVISCVHFIADFTLDLGEVVHDYLA